MENLKKCLSCEAILVGRKDKIYCDQHCKSAYQYQLAQNQAPKFFNKVDNQLKHNRKLLKEFNKAGKAVVRAEVLLELGFNPSFFTHYWKNQKADVYLFVYELGFLKKKENGKEKYVLILWQDYMNTSF